MVECENMNRIGIYVVITFAVCSLLLLPTLSSASSNPEFIMHASGVVQYSASDPSTTINKAVPVFGIGWSDTDITFAAQHFTLIDTDFGYSTAMQSIKAKNPNVKVVGYKETMMYTYLDDWAEVNSHEDWFVHDTNGQRVTSTGWNWYLMDVSSAGYRQHWVSYVNSKLSRQPGYDGVLADDVWNTIADYMLPSFSSTVPASVITNWHTNVIGFLQYAKDNLLSGKILINNSDEWDGTDYISITDGEVIEGFAHASWDSATSYDRPSIDVLATKCVTGKIVFATSGIDGDTATPTQKGTMLQYCYASFLVGMGGSNAYWSWTSTGGAIYNDLYGAFQPIMDTNIGQPTDTYYSSQNVYMRDFTQGKAIVNPSSSTRIVNLGGTYKLLNGTTVSTVTLNSYSGEILLSST
jgi:hypothetical protein